MTSGSSITRRMSRLLTKWGTLGKAGLSRPSNGACTGARRDRRSEIRQGGLEWRGSRRQRDRARLPRVADERPPGEDRTRLLRERAGRPREEPRRDDDRSESADGSEELPARAPHYAPLPGPNNRATTLPGFEVFFHPLAPTSAYTLQPMDERAFTRVVEEYAGRPYAVADRLP